MSTPQEIQVVDNSEAQRYEAQTEAGLAFAEYRPVANALVFSHTEVPEGLEGQGVGSSLLRFALDDARSRGLQVVPMCPFVAAFIGKHREYVDLVHPQQRGVFGL
ncbi:GNAT family N-acetyltransferase [Deinococcus peraridilitoris]|uniref:Putative acetyltransferase n=1 Tax=Deinococcus peraridilitoris (strain DSM 19664 / LMG 22246 / CIP 109416 / KR-200) TaxID=937777 RepID=K9ZZB8_DEIPD|nr:GNAT family N-acetyltransferase [Deinococcus peraridilitoris]AFZ66272.1 putative acetyltransferase [Deinococcus peraridilitoris DSM 19664]